MCGVVSLTYLVKDSEGFSDLLLTVSVLHLPGHHGQELREVDGPVAYAVKQRKESDSGTSHR